TMCVHTILLVPSRQLDPLLRTRGGGACFLSPALPPLQYKFHATGSARETARLRAPGGAPLPGGCPPATGLPVGRASPETPVCYRMDNITMTPSQRLLESKSRECSRSAGRWRGQLRGYPSFSRYVRDACIWVALPLTVVKRTCNENGDPDILLLARFHAQPGGAWHGSHDGILPQS